jgi:N,N'-diacetyllegionaminate synthase
MKKVLIVAEAGVNHNGDFKTAIQMVDTAIEAGVDAIKFQTGIPGKNVSKFAQKAEYQKRHTSGKESQLEMLNKLVLKNDEFIRLKKYCDSKGIIFFSSAFDFESLKFLESIRVKYHKIPSGDIINLPYLEKVGALNKTVLLSTGMASLGEIESAIKILVKKGTSRNKIILLHCTSEYPAPVNEVNLLAIQTLKNAFKLRVGYSDHTAGIEISLAAVALGAEVIEKHFTLNRNMKGPDHKASIEPAELKSMVNAIRNIESALGDGIKKPSKSEIKNMPVIRKSIVAARSIKKGEKFSVNNLALKRPGNGLSPLMWYDVLGKKAKKDFSEDEPVEL